jgi:glycosyltransferase involved in cell wall biosynthesis
MKILVFPRDSQNPYQRLLYGEMERLGTCVSYLGRLTPSRTLNLLLLPLEVAVRRAAGARLVHLHWVFGFSFPGAKRFPPARRLAQTWFALWIRITVLLGMRLVWTAHNVLPHSPVFADDIAARRALVAASELVLAHSQSTLTGLAALGAVPRKSAVIPHGPLAPVLSIASLRAPGSSNGPRRILFFGKVLEYKGVEDLLVAFAALPSDVAVSITIAGQCDDRAMTSRLRTLAQACGDRVILRLERIAEQDIGSLLLSADAVVLPYRRVTTSGTVMLALAYGRPLILPEVDAFAHLPPNAIISYDGTRQGLTSALTRVARAERSALAAMATAATAYASTLSWHDIATRTMEEMGSVLGLKTCADDQGKSLTASEPGRGPAQ